MPPTRREQDKQIFEKIRVCVTRSGRRGVPFIFFYQKFYYLLQNSHAAKTKPAPSVPAKENKQKDMKKVRRKLPSIPQEEELQQTAASKPKPRQTPPRKPPPRADNRWQTNIAVLSIIEETWFPLFIGAHM